MILENKDKFVLVHASSGHKHALDEVLLDENITSRLTDTKVARDVMILNKFMRMLDTDPDRSFYGFQDVKQADEQVSKQQLFWAGHSAHRAGDPERRAAQNTLRARPRNSETPPVIRAPL